jgi:hypothetical protein
MKIDITLTHNKQVLYKMCPEWTTLQANSDADGIYLTWEWVATWWKHFGDENQLWLLQARDHNGRLVGVSALELISYSPSPKYLPMIKWRQLQFTSAERGCEHLGFVIERGLEQEITQSFIKKLRDNQDKWDVWHVSGLCDKSPNYEILANSGMEWTKGEELTAPCMPLPDNWDKYFEGLSKLKRKNERRRIRQLEEEYGDNWAFERLSDPNNLHSSLNKLVELHQKTWTERGMPGAFGNQHFTDFYYDIAHVFLKNNWLRLYRLRLRDEIVGVLCTYEFNGRVYDFVSGVNHEFDDIGVGHLLTHFSLKHAVQDGIREYDFLWGTEPYKYDWNAEDRHHHSFDFFGTPQSRFKQQIVDNLRVLRQKYQERKRAKQAENAENSEAKPAEKPQYQEKF